MSTLRRAARLTYDVGANWKIVAENYSECYHCPPVHKMLNRLTPYDLGEDFLAEGPWKGGWMPFAEGCETMSISGRRDGRPLLYARDETEERRIYYYILWPNLIVSVHPDYVLTHQAWPDGPNRSTVHCDLYVESDQLDAVDISGAVEFWDITNREDYHVVEMQQQGTRSRSWTAGRYSNQEASVHAFDIMVADRYANDGSHTVRGWRTETASDRRLVTKILGPGQQAEAAEGDTDGSGVEAAPGRA
jgi:phenylpropionate dioxygenase-like ring-hydroxylating dioxygenase large terminal subunit